jgi:hypothetical protein
VQSIDPISLNLWNLKNPTSLRVLNDVYSEAQRHPSASALAKLKATYLKTFPELAAAAKGQMEDVKTISDISSLFYAALYRGMRVRFKVKTLFKHGDDDDSSKDAAASDAGEDLSYLFFYKGHPEESTRLEGFTTTDELYQLRLDPMHDAETIQSPVAGVIVQLQSDSLTRYAESDRNGRFVFDGLPEGGYKLSAFAHEFPLNAQVVAGPQPFHMDQRAAPARSCCCRRGMSMSGEGA